MCITHYRSQVVKTALPIPSLSVAGTQLRSLTRDQETIISVTASMSAACVANVSLNYRWEQVTSLPAGVEEFAGVTLSSETVRTAIAILRYVLLNDGNIVCFRESDHDSCTEYQFPHSLLSTIDLPG